MSEEKVSANRKVGFNVGALSASGLAGIFTSKVIDRWGVLDEPANQLGDFLRANISGSDLALFSGLLVALLFYGVLFWKARPRVIHHNHYHNDMVETLTAGTSLEAEVIPASAESKASSSPILFDGIAEAANVPMENHTSLRVGVRNQSNQNLTGLVARLTRAEPALDGLAGATQTPLTLATTTRLDRLRNLGEPLPSLPFNLNAGTVKYIEVAWLPSNTFLEGYITHEAGQATFLFVERQELWVEVSGAGAPIVAVVRIDENEETGGWTVTLIPEAVGAAHG